MSMGFHRKGKPNRPKRLKSLVIDEVSSVDRGAGRGVHVVLLKKHERKPTMPISVEDVRDSNASLIAKANASTELAPDHYEKMQARYALANAAEVFRIKKQFAKDRGIDANSGANPAAQAAAEAEATDWSKVDWNDPVQATKAYRAEKAAKARQSDQGSHQDENTRDRRRPTGARLNPKAVSP
jgi:hypothetical protein